METRKQKLERWLEDAYALFEEVKHSDDTDLIEHVRIRIEELEEESSNLPVEREWPFTKLHNRMDYEKELLKFHNRMDYEKELLTIMMEECGEVIQACSKIIRFGADTINLSNLEKELGDLYQMMELAHQYDLVSWTRIDESSDKKREKLATWSSLIDD